MFLVDRSVAPVMGHQLVSAPASTQRYNVRPVYLCFKRLLFFRAILPIKRVWWADEAIPPLKLNSKKQYIKPKKQLTEAEVNFSPSLHLSTPLFSSLSLYYSCGARQCERLHLRRPVSILISLYIFIPFVGS